MAILQRLVLPMVLAMSLGCTQTKFETIPEAQVDQTQKATAEKFGADTLSAWARNEYPKVSIPADPKFKEGQDDEAKQKAADKSIEAAAGDFVSMTFHEAVKTDPPNLVVYRFKAKFTKKDPMEVRVVFDSGGKIGGFWIKPWNDKIG